MLWDVIVIGVGGMGSAVAYEVASRGRSVLAIEQSNIPNDLGSSHGVNRIIRLAYAEDKRYVPLLKRSYKLWRQLGHLAKEKLLFITGGIDAGPETGVIVKGALRACVEYKLRYEQLTSTELKKRFPGYQLPKDMVAVYQPQGGFVLSERAIVNQVLLALDRGAEIHACERVLSWHVRRGVVHVKTDRSDYRGARLVITAGPWIGHLDQRFITLVRPERQVLIWTQPKKPERFKLDSFPVFNMQNKSERYYGFPIYGIPGFKIGKYHHLGGIVDPNTMNRTCNQTDEKVLRRAIRKYFPDADGPTMAMKTCLFSNTSDEHFILDLHPEYSQVSIAAGFSGHGFKFCPVVGEIMADFALEGGVSSFDLGLFKIKRQTLIAH